MTQTFDFENILKNVEHNNAPPLHLWNPQLCGDIDISIDTQGVWRHCGDTFKRTEIPQLFSRILCREEGDYYLKTPVEKWRIKVADVPFYFIHLEQRQTDQGKTLCFVSLNEDVVELSERNPLRVSIDSNTGEPSPYIHVRDGMEGKLSRNLYYQLIDMAINDEQAQQLYLESQGQRFLLGSY